MSRFSALATLAVLALTCLGLSLCAGIAHASPVTCPKPSAAPWRYHPDGCRILPRNGLVTLPRGVTEVDIWSMGGRVHLTQTRDRYGTQTCPLWGFDAKRSRYSAGWVTCNRDVFNYGAMVRVYFWRG